MVALYWIVKGNYKQFVVNRVKQIKAKDYIQRGHVSSGQNPADLGSRGNQSKVEGTRLSFQTRNVASNSANQAQ